MPALASPEIVTLAMYSIVFTLIGICDTGLEAFLNFQPCNVD